MQTGFGTRTVAFRTRMILAENLSYGPIIHMSRFFVAVSIALAALNVPSAAAELVYVEWKGCGYCKVFNREMAWAYISSSIGKKIPLRRVDILGRWPADLKRVSRPSYTPVFILVEHGREVGRFDGYTSPQGFGGNLQRLLQRRK